MIDLEQFPLFDDISSEQLVSELNDFGGPGALPRETLYGSDEAISRGLIPFEETPLKPIPKNSWKEVIDYCHERQIFPLYHQEAAGLLKDWNQDGLGYCWAWSLTAAVMGCRELEGQERVLLAPVSLGFSVNWKNEGNTLDKAIKDAAERGIAPQEYVPGTWNRNYNTYKEGWQEAAKKFRPLEWWDIDTYRGNTDNIIGQCLAVLATGRPLYVAYMWWAHAVECVALQWRDGIVWVIQNSHNDGIIRLTGSRGIPSEAYGIRATVISNQKIS